MNLQIGYSFIFCRQRLFFCAEGAGHLKNSLLYINASDCRWRNNIWIATLHSSPMNWRSFQNMRRGPTYSSCRRARLSCRASTRTRERRRLPARCSRVSWTGSSNLPTLRESLRFVGGFIASHWWPLRNQGTFFVVNENLAVIVFRNNFWIINFYYCGYYWVIN